MTLPTLGWNEFFERSFHALAAADLTPARVTLEHKHRYHLLAPGGELTATCTGRLLHGAATREDLPAVGDWVAVRLRPGERHADIHAVLPRRTVFSRRAAGDAPVEQIVAANVDTVFLVSALDGSYNLRRIERYLAAAWESGAAPVVVLNKADLHPEPADALREVAAIAGGAPIVALSAQRDDPRPALAPWLMPGRTIALLGSSGVGKSTLINRLVEAERQATGAISSAVNKGRHTTTHRELLVAPSGVLVIDTPGMRELQLWDTAATAVDHAFAEIATLAERCRFRDCSHRGEPGCAIADALDRGALDPSRWQSYQKLQREQAYAARRADPQFQRAERDKWKKIHRGLRALQRFREDE